MHYTDHSLLTALHFRQDLQNIRRFDTIHYFIDNTKKYHWHASHRLLKHTIDYGQWLLIRKFGHVFSGLPTNEILIQHLLDDFTTKTPRLQNFLKYIDVEDFPLEDLLIKLKSHKSYLNYIVKIYEITGDPKSLYIPCSLFGGENYSTSAIKNLGFIKTLKDNGLLFDIKKFVSKLRFVEPWMNTPDREKIQTIKTWQKNKTIPISTTNLLKK